MTGSGSATCRVSRETTAWSINPTGASRIEVVRGPATLLYGSNAIGGLVNVISDTIPTTRVNGVQWRDDG